jgi:hypothetical protein
VVDRAASAQHTSGRRGLEPEAMRLEWTSETGRLMLFVARMRGVRTDDELQLTDLDLRLFYSHRP